MIFDSPWFFILPAIFLISPFVLALASRQDKKTKHILKTAFQFLLLLQVLAGFLNWETFEGAGRSGFGLALAYPQSFLWLFFLISAGQFFLLFFPKLFVQTTMVVLNFLNSIIFFISMITISNLVGKQTISIISIAVAFLVLIGNVVGLSLINRDPKLLAKFWPIRG